MSEERRGNPGIATPDAGALHRVVQHLVMVKPGEAAALLWSAAYFFFLLSSYYLLRPVREAMGVDRGADKLTWLMTGTLGVMFLVNPVFSAMVSRWPRRVFIPVTYRFFMANLVVFYILFKVLSKESQAGLGYGFYIWTSVFNLFAVSIFWAFMADTWTHEQSKRLFGFIGVGGTLGAIAGAAATEFLSSTGAGRTEARLAPETLMLLAALGLEIAVECMRRLARRTGAQAGVRRSIAEPGPAPRDPREPGPGVFAGLTLIARSPYLLLICLYMLVFTTTSTFLYMEQGRLIEQAFPDRAARTAAFAGIDWKVNVLTLAAQVFLTGRIVRWLGIGGTLLLLPAISTAGFAWMWLAPGLGAMMAFQIVRRSAHYAVDRPAREVLFTVLGPDEKYKSKSFIDTFVYRAGDMAGAWVPRWLAAVSVPLTVVAVPLALLWLVVAAVLGVRHRAEAARVARPPEAPQP